MNLQEAIIIKCEAIEAAYGKLDDCETAIVDGLCVDLMNGMQAKKNKSHFGPKSALELLGTIAMVYAEREEEKI